MADSSEKSAGAGAVGLLDHGGFNLLEVMKQQDSGCPVCRLVSKGVSNYLEGISYENVNDPDTRQQIRDALGWCAVHGQEWLRLQDTLGTAIIYRDVLSTVLTVLQAGVAPEQGVVSKGNGADGGLAGRLQGMFRSERAGSDSGRVLAAGLEPSGPCPACKEFVKLEKDLGEAFARGLVHGRFVEAYRKHDTGLCVPHLRQILPLIGRDTLVRSLVHAQQAKLERTVADLAEVIRKYDYRFLDEPHGEEFQTPAKSVGQASGNLPTQIKLPGKQAGS